MHERGAVRGQVVQHDVHLERGGDARVDLAQKRDEIRRAMPWLAARQHLTGGDVQRGEQVQRPVSNVVMGPSFGASDRRD